MPATHGRLGVKTRAAVRIIRMPRTDVCGDGAWPAGSEWKTGLLRKIAVAASK